MTNVPEVAGVVSGVLCRREKKMGEGEEGEAVEEVHVVVFAAVSRARSASYYQRLKSSRQQFMTKLAIEKV